MKRKIASGVMFTLLLIGTLSFSFCPTIAGVKEQENCGIEFGHREIIVKFKSSVSVDTKSSALTVGVHSIDWLNKLYGVVGIEKVFLTSHPALSNVYKLKFSNDVDILSIADEYDADPNVDYAEPSYVGHATLTPNDSDYALQWGHPKIESELAWNINKGDSDIVIAVVDTGVDWNHPDLAVNIWNNTAETLNGVDDDGNGFVDDVRGWDFVDTTDPVWPGEDGTIRDNDPMDFHGHGTHVAGIAAAVTNNTIGVAGMSWASKIMVVRAGYMNSTGYGRFWWSDVAPAITYAVDNGADIISMSFGGYGSSSLLKIAVDYAYANDVFLVAAAGNDNIQTRLYPAGYENVTAVAATNSTDGKAWFSNYGSWVDVSAPGVNIYSTLFDDTYASWNGTSMSAPFVAGLAGLILSENTALSNEEVRNVIRNTTDSVTSSEYIGTGRVNAYKALLSVRVPRTWTVDDDGPADFSTIEDAVAAANPSDTILVRKGDYYGNQYGRVNIGWIGSPKDGLSIIGEDKYLTVLHGGFQLWTSHSTIMNLKILPAEVHGGYETGIRLESSSFNRIENNIISGGQFGLDFAHYEEEGTPTCENNIVVGNVIENLLIGALFRLGLTNNRFYHNNFINNERNVDYVSSLDEIWDNGYPSGGNYWSDHIGTDNFTGPYQNVTGSDGIVDTPYVIDVNNQDNYPLMNPWTPLVGDVDSDRNVDIYDLSIFAGAYGTSVGQPRYHVRCDLDQNGDIDIYDLGILALNYGKTI